MVPLRKAEEERLRAEHEAALVGVATLALGLRPRQGSCEVAGLEVDPGVTSHAPGSAKGVRE